MVNKESFVKYQELEVEIVDPGILISRRLEHILEPRSCFSSFCWWQSGS